MNTVLMTNSRGSDWPQTCKYCVNDGTANGSYFVTHQIICILNLLIGLRFMKTHELEET